MKKIFILLAILTYTTMLFGAYDVKIGVFKNAKNLRTHIAKIKSSKYRNYIVVQKKNKLNYAHAVIDNGMEAKKALGAYKRVFKDAFISKRQVRIKKTVKKVSSPLIQKKHYKKVHHEEKVEKINARDFLANKTVYLCYEKGPRHLKSRVVKMVFEKKYVIYNPLKKMATPVNMPYEFIDNTLTLHLSSMNIMHNVYKKEENVLYVKSMIDGLVVNKLRYYFDETSALAFVSGN